MVDWCDFRWFVDDGDFDGVGIDGVCCYGGVGFGVGFFIECCDKVVECCIIIVLYFY